MTEHRAHPRMPIELEVQYKRLNGFFSDYTKNISKGGTFIRTKKPLPIGTPFLFRLKVPSCLEAFEVMGEVVRSEGIGDAPGMAIRFVWRDETVRATFEQMVEKLMAESFGPVVAAGLLDASRGGPDRQ